MLKVANSVINASQITGVLPVLNGGTGVTTSTGTGNTVLSATPTLSGNVTLSTGNLVQGTAAKGINFTANTPAAGMTSQLLNWYEEGTWTPTDASGAGLSFTISYAKYTRVGRQITINMFITYPVTASVSAAALDGLPFAVAGSNYPPLTIVGNSGVALSAYANATITTITIGTAANYATTVSNVTLSGTNMIISGTYFV